MLSEFKQFLVRGNAVDLAVGVVVGAAFGAVVNTLVADVLTPLIGALARVPDFSGLSVTINGSVVTYGKFLNAVISFVLVASAIFFGVVKPMNVLMARARRDETSMPRVRPCPECLTDMPHEARRCAACGQAVTQES